VDGIFEELDAPNEFFYDKSTQNLYYYFNGSGTPPSTGFVRLNDGRGEERERRERRGKEEMGERREGEEVYS
jgi:hypothetical protein